MMMKKYTLLILEPHYSESNQQTQHHQMSMLVKESCQNQHSTCLSSFGRKRAKYITCINLWIILGHYFQHFRTQNQQLQLGIQKQIGLRSLYQIVLRQLSNRRILVAIVDQLTHLPPLIRMFRNQSNNMSRMRLYKPRLALLL